MIDAVQAGALNLEKLEAMTCVCSVGLDMIAVPGDTSAETLSAIIADEAAIGMVNAKTTAVRIIPVPGKTVGDEVEFGGLLGRGTPDARQPVRQLGVHPPRRAHPRSHPQPEKLNGAALDTHRYKSIGKRPLPVKARGVFAWAACGFPSPPRKRYNGYVVPNSAEK